MKKTVYIVATLHRYQGCTRPDRLAKKTELDHPQRTQVTERPIRQTAALPRTALAVLICAQGLVTVVQSASQILVVLKLIEMARSVASAAAGFAFCSPEFTRWVPAGAGGIRG